MTSEQIKKLQTELNQKGANLKVDGILGPKTTAAMSQFASTVATGAPNALTTTDQIKALQTQLNANGAGLKVDGILGPKTTAAMNNAVATSISSNPSLAHLTAQNSPESILEAYNSGDWSGVIDTTGKPFSDADQAAAVEKARLALAPGFDEAQRYEENTTGAALSDAERGYNEYLKGQEANFQVDKENLDQTAANNGVLFSGGRLQKEQNLRNTYERADAAKRAATGSTISKTANEFQYKYGDTAATKPSLSQYYQLGSNTYNPNVARNGVSTGGLSSVYNTGGKNYQGTETVKNKAAVQTRAASLLGNKANKIVPYGYNNQL